MPVPPKIIVEDTRLIADEITRTAENVPNVSVVTIEVVGEKDHQNNDSTRSIDSASNSIITTINLFT